MLSFQTKQQPVRPSSSKQTCQDTQEQHTQEPDPLDRDTQVLGPLLLDKDTLVQQELLHQVKVMLEGLVLHHRVRAIQGLLLKDILELELLQADLKDTQELGLLLDNKDTEVLLLTRDMVVELLLKAMEDNNRDTVEQLPHLSRVVDMVEDHL